MTARAPCERQAARPISRGDSHDDEVDNPPHTSLACKVLNQVIFATSSIERLSTKHSRLATGGIIAISSVFDLIKRNSANRRCTQTFLYSGKKMPKSTLCRSLVDITEQKGVRCLVEFLFICRE